MRFVRSMLVLGIGAFALVSCGGGESASSFCDLAREFDAQSDVLSDVEDEAAMKQAVETMKKLESAAPSEIKGDVKVAREYSEKFLEGDLDFMTDESNTTKLDEASSNLQSYLTKECGIEATE